MEDQTSDPRNDPHPRVEPADADARRTIRPRADAAPNAVPARPVAVDPIERQARAAFERARAGDRAAYGQVVRIYHDRLYNAVYRLLHHHDDAAEIVQDTFARGLQKLDDFRGDAGPYTWLFRIAMNAAVSRIRKSRRRQTVSLDAVVNEKGGWKTSYGGSVGNSIADPSPAPGEQAEQSEDHRAVVHALEKLDSEYRALLVMRDLEGFDYKQMAEILDMPLGTLKSRLFRARVALRELLQDHFRSRRRQGSEPGEP